MPRSTENDLSKYQLVIVIELQSKPSHPFLVECRLGTHKSLCSLDSDPASDYHRLQTLRCLKLQNTEYIIHGEVTVLLISANFVLHATL